MDISLQRIAAAAAAIDPVFRNSPQFVCEGLSAELGAPVMLKVETLNPIRSFKGRGSSWFAQNVKDKNRPVICASAGNFGQGVCWHARRADRESDCRHERQPLEAGCDAQVRRRGHPVWP
jgi:threonine dehydratase